MSRMQRSPLTATEETEFWVRLKRALLRQLRRPQATRRSRHATIRGQRRGQIVDAVSIRDRPAAVEDRAIPGHWEGDLLAGARRAYVATLVERQSRYVLLVRLQAHLDRIARRLNSRPRRTLSYQTPADRLAAIVASAG